MKAATVRDLRNHFPRVAAWIAEGESVVITRAGRPFARLIPASHEKPRALAKVGFARQLRRTWGRKMFTRAEVAAMRAAELAGDAG